MFKFTLEQLKDRITQMEKYLGPKVGYSSDPLPMKLPERWLMEYLHILKHRYYRNLRRMEKSK